MSSVEFTPSASSLRPALGREPAELLRIEDRAGPEEGRGTRWRDERTVGPWITEVGYLKMTIF